jgi:pimeloyl-ACP methyl ester carboxylesterase
MKRRWRLLAALSAALLLLAPIGAGAAEPYGLTLEGYAYPYPVQFLPLEMAHHKVRLAYMDVPSPGAANGRTVLLFHGRNFPAAYWQPTIAALTAAGYRTVAPDQIGFGKSSKLDDAPISFDEMASHMAALLDRLGLVQVDVLAHSMGNMAAVRFTRTFADRVGKLIMYAPVGLEDYRLYVPPVPRERLLEQEDRLDAEAYITSSSPPTG